MEILFDTFSQQLPIFTQAAFYGSVINTQNHQKDEESL